MMKKLKSLRSVACSPTGFHVLILLQERLKREYKTANKTREGYIDESDEEEKPEMSKAERRMQKLIRSREGNDAYESDDEKNPYASSVRLTRSSTVLNSPKTNRRNHRMKRRKSRLLRLPHLRLPNLANRLRSLSLNHLNLSRK